MTQVSSFFHATDFMSQVRQFLGSLLLAGIGTECLIRAVELYQNEDRDEA